MKYIFLDVDGVLNRDGCAVIAEDGEFIAREPLDRLAEIVERTGAKIVLTSTWKTGWSPVRGECDFMAGYLCDKLASRGMTVYDKTGGEDLERIFKRGEWVKRYLDEHPADGFVILDDKLFDYGDHGLADRLVKTSNVTGITASDVERAVAILNGTTAHE